VPSEPACYNPWWGLSGGVLIVPSEPACYNPVGRQLAAAHSPGKRFLRCHARHRSAVLLPAQQGNSMLPVKICIVYDVTVTSYTPGIHIQDIIILIIYMYILLHKYINTNTGLLLVPQPHCDRANRPPDPKVGW